MKDLIVRFLQASRIDPVYFVTCVVDVIAIFLWRGLRRGTTATKSALYKAVILVAIVLTAASLSRFFGLIKHWKELEFIFRF
jgi:hypothetical protein